mmetsp:Transcript_38833/g.100386  ORF Transcript_38833/g.100386 Transcript_38833/m.100386 type:complete len:375 (-) Transcript_38833:672-1796(-)
MVIVRSTFGSFKLFHLRLLFFLASVLLLLIVVVLLLVPRIQVVPPPAPPPPLRVGGDHLQDADRDLGLSLIIRVTFRAECVAPAVGEELIERIAEVQRCSAGGLILRLDVRRRGAGPCLRRRLLGAPTSSRRRPSGTVAVVRVVRVRIADVHPIAAGPEDCLDRRLPAKQCHRRGGHGDRTLHTFAAGHLNLIPVPRVEPPLWAPGEDVLHPDLRRQARHACVARSRQQRHGHSAPVGQGVEPAAILRPGLFAEGKGERHPGQPDGLRTIVSDAARRRGAAAVACRATARWCRRAARGRRERWHRGLCCWRWRGHRHRRRARLREGGELDRTQDFHVELRLRYPHHTTELLRMVPHLEGADQDAAHLQEPVQVL